MVVIMLPPNRGRPIFFEGKASGFFKFITQITQKQLLKNLKHVPV